MKNKKLLDPKMIGKLEALLRDDQKIENLYQSTPIQKNEFFWQAYHKELNQKLSDRPILRPLFSLLPVWFALAVALAIALGVLMWQMKPSPVSTETVTQRQELLNEWSKLEERGEVLDLSEMLSNEELSDYMLAEYQTLNQLDQEFTRSSLMPGR